MTDKIIIYQIFTRLYGNRCTARVPNGSIEENGCGKLNGFTPKVLKQIREMGVSHVWYTGIIRHATTTDYTRYGLPRQHPAVVKGRAGSPYAIVDYYDVDPDLAEDVDKRMQEFERLVSRTHRAGLKVVIDFVPNHVARQYHSVARPEGVRDLGEDDNPQVGFDPERNNFYYCPGQTFTPYFDLYHGEREPYTETPAKATGNDCFHNAPGRNDWYETVKLNYGVDYYAGHVGHFQPTPDTWTKMLHILLFWAQKGVDAFRCDMAEMVPAEFWAWATARVREAYPEVRFIGEVYNPAEYRRYIASGFDYLYDKVGMYDAMRDVICHRRTSEAITQAWQQTDDIRDHMLYFLENHDEQRLASDFFAGSGEKGVPGLVVSALMQKGPFMLYFGQEWGERGMDAEGFSGCDGRTTIFDYWSLQPADTPLTEVYRKVLNIARTERCVREGQMFDVMYANRQYARQYAFLRKAGKDVMLVVANFDDQPASLQLNIPDHAFDYLEMQERAYRAEDLLNGEERSLVLIKGTPVEVTLEPRGAAVYKLR
ncbi:MAG: alpha-glucosidase C-terminal domain-containing protein [Prevotella sp.]|nr:alpha-glucosidase C-terminal domain-containing protein [Prevotella sp.]MBR1755858.1 alpha-glucosidase C-terminal domain-containing protein [Bacteroidaceae bacterium]